MTETNPEPRPRIRFCVNNPRTLAERNALIADGYESLGCLGNCDRCFETRYLEIDGRFVEGASYEEILRAPEIRCKADAPPDQGAKKTPREDRGASREIRPDDDHAGA